VKTYERFQTLSMRLFGLYTLLMTFSFCVRAQVSSAPSQAADTLSIPGMKVMANIRYGRADPKQNFDLYLPDRTRRGAGVPLMIWIHGGGWRMGVKKEMEIAYLADHGYAIASIDYRFSRDSVFPAQVRDCNAAIRLLWKNAGRWGLDTARFIIAGASAGGHLASLIGMSLNNHRQDFDPYPLADHPVSIKAVINFYGPADFYAFHGDGPGYKVDSATSSVSLLLGGTSLSRPDRARYASPTTYVDKGDPPVLILHGDKDPIIPLYLDELFFHVLQQAGVKSELMILPGAGHGGPAFSGDSSREKVLSFLQEILSPIK
jgi:acetyl esterase/lipase